MFINAHKNRYKMAVIALCSFGFGFFVHVFWVSRSVPSDAIEQNKIATYKYTNPYLECMGELNGSRSLVAAKTEVQKYINHVMEQDPSLDISVYTRNLNTGAWFGINEKHSFIPASLFKIPVMMQVLSKAEDDVAMLQEKVVAKPEGEYKSVNNLINLDQSYRLEEGKEYTIDELLYRMIAYSDNHAYELLVSRYPREEIVALMQELNFFLDADNDGVYNLTAKEYAAILRALYNSTFFSRPISEVALEYMTYAAYGDGLRKYLPDDLMVASKYGNYDIIDGGEKKVGFHECGIVYTEKPYVICVLSASKQTSAVDLSEMVSQISKTIYEHAE